MNHLSDDQIYTLAGKVIGDADLTAEEAAALKHVAECDECYHLLSCMMAMQNVARNMGQFAAPAQAPVRETITAVIRLVADQVNAALDQIGSGLNAWTFRRAPLSLAGARSGGRRSAVKKLADADNARTFVAYDPERKLLVIQLDPGECDGAPRAFLAAADATRTEIPLQLRGEVYWGEVRDLDGGDYEIILEK